MTIGRLGLRRNLRTWGGRASMAGASLELGLTMTASFGPGDAIEPIDFGTDTPITFALDVTGLSDGLILETGGGNGAYVGSRAGDFFAGYSFSQTAFVQAPRPSGDGTLVVLLDPGAAVQVRSWMNGVELPGYAETGKSSNWTGGATGGYLAGIGAIGGGFAGVDETPATYADISNLRVYDGQRPAGV